MIPTPNQLSSCQPASSRLRKLLLLPAAGVILACSSCDESTPPKYSPPVTDTRPVGEGIKVLAFAILGAAVVGVLGRMLKK